MNIQWRNQVVLLTGATGGIGQAIAKALDEKGAHIILTGRSKAKLEQLQQNLTLHHTAIVADITSDEGRDNLSLICFAAASASAILVPSKTNTMPKKYSGLLRAIASKA